MVQENPDDRSRDQARDSDQESQSGPYGVSRRYWGGEPPTNGASLPHWTEPATGEIPKVFGLTEKERRGADRQADETDHGATSFQRERRRLESGDHLGTFQDEGASKGRHFAQSHEPVPNGADPAGTEEFAAPPKDDRGVRVISSRPSPRAMRERPSKRPARPQPEPAQPSHSAASDPTPDGEVALELPESRRSTLRRRSGQKRDSRGSGGDSPQTHRDPGPSRDGSGRSGGSVATRTLTGLILGAVIIGAFKVGQPAVLVVLTLALLIAAAEFYQLVRREHPGSPKGGYRPAVFVGLVGVVGAVAGGYMKGPSAIALVLTFTLLASFLWYLLGVLKVPMLVNTGVTFLGVAWIGLGGSYVAAIIRPVSGDPRKGLAYMMAVLIAVVAGDVFAYFGGKLIGKRPMAPSISPGKTMEGLIIGAIGAILAGALIASRIHPVTMSLGASIGILAALGGPCGDLVESKIKREIGAKDAGAILPGHGGFLDRVDALIFVTPLVYYLLYFTHHIG